MPNIAQDHLRNTIDKLNVISQTIEGAIDILFESVKICLIDYCNNPRSDYKRLHDYEGYEGYEFILEILSNEEKDINAVVDSYLYSRKPADQAHSDHNDRTLKLKQFKTELSTFISDHIDPAVSLAGENSHSSKDELAMLIQLKERLNDAIIQSDSFIFQHEQAMEAHKPGVAEGCGYSLETKLNLLMDQLPTEQKQDIQRKINLLRSICERTGARFNAFSNADIALSLILMENRKSIQDRLSASTSLFCTSSKRPYYKAMMLLALGCVHLKTTLENIKKELFSPVKLTESSTTSPSKLKPEIESMLLGDDGIHLEQKYDCLTTKVNEIILKHIDFYVLSELNPLLKTLFSDNQSRSLVEKINQATSHLASIKQQITDYLKDLEKAYQNYKKSIQSEPSTSRDALNIPANTRPRGKSFEVSSTPPDMNTFGRGRRLGIFNSASSDTTPGKPGAPALAQPSSPVPKLVVNDAHNES